MRTRRLRMIVMAAGLLASWTELRADTVFLTDGRVLRGFVLERSLDSVRFVTEEGPLLVSEQSVQILRVDPSPLALCVVWARQIPDNDRMGWLRLALFARQQGLERIANTAMVMALDDAMEIVRSSGQKASHLMDTASGENPPDTSNALRAAEAPPVPPDSYAARTAEPGAWGDDISTIRRQSRFHWVTPQEATRVEQRRRQVRGRLYPFQPSVPPQDEYFAFRPQKPMVDGEGGWHYLFPGNGTLSDMLGRLATRSLLDALYGPSTGLALSQYQDALLTQHMVEMMDRQRALDTERAQAERAYLRYWREEFERGRASWFSNPGWTTEPLSQP